MNADLRAQGRPRVKLRTAKDELHASAASESAAKGFQLPFVAGPENELLVSTLRQFMRNGRVSADEDVPRLLVLVGPHGSGKSHLAQGLASTWKELHPEHHVLFESVLDFYRRFADACQHGDTRDYGAEYAAAGLFVLDDVDKLASRASAKGLFKAVLEARAQAQLPTVVTSTRPVQQALSPDDAPLTSRLSGGLELRVQFPGDAAKRRILEIVATHYGVSFSPESVAHLVDRKQLSAERLRFEATEIAAHHGSHSSKGTNPGKIVELPSVVAWLQANRSQPAAEDIQHLAKAVARKYGVALADLRSPSRRKTVVKARGVTAYLAHKSLGMSYEQIGMALGRRDRTTVMHAVEKIHSLADQEHALKSVLEHFQTDLGLVSTNRPSSTSNAARLQKPSRNSC